ncbi:hypothetical protein M0R45_027267 [Rubus argutus]|uniref:Neurobeachin alpha-solenoid region domain-containing protein n=1 Tax=Rubus argutus TaxID=59490 RepID=A0AAW1X1M4_RUBAR
MNIVKGVADLIRRTSSVQDVDSLSGSQSQSEGGDEAVLNILWARYQKAADKVEKRRLLHVFLKQFLVVYKNWEPVNSGQIPEAASTTIQPAEFDDVVIGCFAGHPAEVILVLTEEITQLTAMVVELNSSTVRSADFCGHSTILNIISEGIPLLDALLIVTRSLHNCRVLGYYGGIPKLTALMKGVVVQLKTISFVLGGGASPADSSSSSKVPSSDVLLHWHQKAVVSVMEAGGLNWVVELLRVIRRTLVVKVILKSIGGLEVLLDGLGIPSNNGLILKTSACAADKRFENPLLKIFQLHVLSLEVLREAVFGNNNNLQFLCDNGRVQKFASSFCSPAFMFQEYKQQTKDLPGQQGSQMPAVDYGSGNTVKNCVAESSVALPANGSYSQVWCDYVLKLTGVFCSFLPSSEYIKSDDVDLSTGRIAMANFIACSNQNELSSHLRVFVTTLQHCVLDAFRKILVSSPVSLQIFRQEGIWELIFSENFFYFGPAPEDLSGECCTHVESQRKNEMLSSSSDISSQAIVCGIEVLQMEVISFVEFVATSNGSAVNLPELSALLDALEQTACNPEVSSALAKSLLRILQLSVEKTIASFKAVNAFPRVLKVACIQAQESRRS